MPEIRMKKLITAISIIISTLTITACASYGRDFNLSDVDRLNPGLSTYQQAVEILGKPQAVVVVRENTKHATWQYTKSVMGSVESKTVTLIFNKEGIYQGVSMGGQLAPN